MIQGFVGGIDAVKHNGNFWTGKGAKYSCLAAQPGNNSVTVGDGMDYSNEYALEFKNENYGDIEGLDNLYADGSLATGDVRPPNSDLVFNENGEEIWGSTIYDGFVFKGTRSDVYLYKNAFISKQKLYLAMGHEFVHVRMIYAGISSVARQEAVAYKWMEIQWNRQYLIPRPPFPWSYKLIIILLTING